MNLNNIPPDEQFILQSIAAFIVLGSLVFNWISGRRAERRRANAEERIATALETIAAALHKETTN